MTGSFVETDVEYAVLNTLSTQLASLASGVEDDLNALAAEVAILNSSWSGAAHDAFVVRYSGWTVDADDARVLLARAASAISLLTDKYEQTDTEVVGLT